MPSDNFTVNPSLMYPPEYYSLVWLFVGLLFIAVIAIGIFLILFLTRKKPIKKISNLAPKPVALPDITTLRNKYLSLVDKVAEKYGNKKCSAIVAHQELSLIVRLFYAEAGGFHAEVLTLRDLKKSRNSKLATLIEVYYPEEFSCLEHGPISKSVEGAKAIIRDDEVIDRVRKVAE